MRKKEKERESEKENVAGIAQLVERRAEKLGAILTRFESLARLGIFLPGSTFSALSYGVRTANRQLPNQHLCAR